MSTWGNDLKISIFGESHGPGIGVVIDGLPAGLPIDREELAAFMARRAPRPGQGLHPRRETDRPELLSGVRGDVTTARRWPPSSATTTPTRPTTASSPLPRGRATRTTPVSCVTRAGATCAAAGIFPAG